MFLNSVLNKNAMSLLYLINIINHIISIILRIQDLMYLGHKKILLVHMLILMNLKYKI